MNVRAILARHFEPAGVMGVGNSAQLERDLRRCARLNAALYGALLILLVAVLIGIAFVIVEDVRSGRDLRTILLAGAGLAFPVILEWIRRTVRAWSEASLLARLSRRLEGPQLQSVIETLIDAN